QKLQQREAMLANAESAWSERQRQDEKSNQDREREAVGLESRIANLRTSLAELQQATNNGNFDPGSGTAFERIASRVGDSEQSGTSGATEVCGMVAKTAEDHLQERLVILDKIACELADQRLHLNEQFDRLLQVQEEWRSERESAAEEIESLARKLAEREQH